MVAHLDSEKPKHRELLKSWGIRDIEELIKGPPKPYIETSDDTEETQQVINEALPQYALEYAADYLKSKHHCHNSIYLEALKNTQLKRCSKILQEWIFTDPSIRVQPEPKEMLWDHHAETKECGGVPTFYIAFKDWETIKKDPRKLAKKYIDFIFPFLLEDHLKLSKSVIREVERLLLRLQQCETSEEVQEEYQQFLLDDHSAAREAGVSVNWNIPEEKKTVPQCNSLPESYGLVRRTVTQPQGMSQKTTRNSNHHEAAPGRPGRHQSNGAKTSGSKEQDEMTRAIGLRGEQIVFKELLDFYQDNLSFPIKSVVASGGDSCVLANATTDEEVATARWLNGVSEAGCDHDIVVKWHSPTDRVDKFEVKSSGYKIEHIRISRSQWKLAHNCSLSNNTGASLNQRFILAVVSGVATTTPKIGYYIDPVACLQEGSLFPSSLLETGFQE